MLGMEEPQLKYESLGGDVRSILRPGNEVTCLCLSDKILAIGTSKGNVHVLDYSGDEIRCLNLHRGRVNELSFDQQEEHMASCSDDCTVTVFNLYNDEKQSYTFKHAIKTIALDPRYSSRRTKEYIAAGDNNLVQLSTQGWLGRSDYTLHEGKVQLVRWSGALVAWASHKSVTIYDTNSHLQIRTITRYPHAPVKKTGPAGSPGQLARPHLEGKVSVLFGQNNRLYIAWPDCIKIARITASTSSVSTTLHAVEVVSEFFTSYFVLGVAPFGEDLAVLTYPTESDVLKQQQEQAEMQAALHHSEIVPQVAAAEAASVPMHVEAGHRPVLKIISTSNQILAEDALPIEGWERFGPTDYLLVPSLPVTSEQATSSKKFKKRGMSSWWSVGGSKEQTAAEEQAQGDEAEPEKQGDTFKPADVESLYFIVAPQTIHVSRTRDMNDHVLWLLEQGRFEEALTITEHEQFGVQADTVNKVTQGYIDHLLQEQSYELAARLSPRLLKENGGMWQSWVMLFAQTRQLPKLAPYIPTERPRLPETAYEMVLRSLMMEPQDHELLLSLVRAWPPDLCSMTAIQDAVQQRMRRPGGDDEHMWRLLSLLYERQGRPDLSLAILLQLRTRDVFAFIEKHALVTELGQGGRAATLLEIDERAALRLLTHNVDKLPPPQVVPSIQEAMDAASSRGDDAEASTLRKRLHKYLAGVLALDAAAACDYHELQVQLTADYEPAKLMDFLCQSQYYPLEAALSICQRQGLVAEQVYILGRMGNSRQALHLIIDKLGDIPQAIEFVRSQRDEELWDYLITWALGSADNTGALMDHAGGSINPLTLIRRLPRGLKVPRLRDRLRTIISDFRTQTSLHEGCNVILSSDCMHLMNKLYYEARACLKVCYVEWRDRSGVATQWHRYHAMSGAFEHVPVHSLPETVLTQAPLKIHPQASAAAASAELTGDPSARQQHGVARAAAARRWSVWIGLNLDDAETHIKLIANRKDTAQPAGANRPQGKKKPHTSMYDAAAWGPHATAGQVLPSLIRS